MKDSDATLDNEPCAALGQKLYGSLYEKADLASTIASEWEQLRWDKDTYDGYKRKWDDVNRQLSADVDEIFKLHEQPMSAPKGSNSDNTSPQKLEQGPKRPEPTKGRRWKLPVTFVGLVLLSLVILGSILVLGASNGPLPMGKVLVHRGWLMAVLGGALGGLARALYYFMFDSYAFRYRYTTKISSPYIKAIYGLSDKDMEDDFDPVDSWYLFFVKPIIGATLGLLFGLAAELGLIALAGEVKNEDQHAIRLVVLAGMAGLFAENVHHRLEALVKPKS
jgi:hypothetical protein